MLLKTKEILEKSNYYIRYDYHDKERGSEIYISWKNIRYIFRYDYEKQELYSSYEDIVISCEEYIVPCLVDLLLNSIASEFGYSGKLILKYYKGNFVINTLFDSMSNKEQSDKFQNLLELYQDMMVNNVVPEHFELAKEHNIQDGYRLLAELYLGVSIELS